MPIRLVQSQFTVVRPRRVATGVWGDTGSLASKLRAPAVLMVVPLWSFLRSAG